MTEDNEAMTKRKRRYIPKPFSEMQPDEQVRECRTAIASLERQLEANRRSTQGYSLEVSKNTIAAIERWKKTLGQLIGQVVP